MKRGIEDRKRTFLAITKELEEVSKRWKLTRNKNNSWKAAALEELCRQLKPFALLKNRSIQEDKKIELQSIVAKFLVLLASILAGQRLRLCDVLEPFYKTKTEDKTGDDEEGNERAGEQDPKPDN